MKAYTDIEQSKKLAEILLIESADHHYVRKVTDFMGNPVDGEWSHPKYGNPNSKYANYIVQNFTSYEKLPCWSLAALFNILPHTLDGYNLISGKLSYNNAWYVMYDDFDHFTKYLNIFKYRTVRSNLVDACYEMIIKLHEEKLL